MSEPMTLSRADPTLRFSIHPLAHAAYQWILTYPPSRLLEKPARRADQPIASATITGRHVVPAG